MCDFFVCPSCKSRFLIMGFYVEEDAPCFLRCACCGFTQNFPREIMDFPGERIHGFAQSF